MKLITIVSVFLYSIIILLSCCVDAFHLPSRRILHNNNKSWKINKDIISSRKLSTTTTTFIENSAVVDDEDKTEAIRCSSIFDFANNDTITNFDRIDDVIMGGMSSSSFRDAEGKDYAIWSGICRTDGGGFCGTRTRPFREPLQIMDTTTEGFYIECRFTSDTEPDRRVWKMSTRTEQSRGEELYLTDFKITNNEEKEWNRIYLPFSSFQKVRGPRLIPNASSFDPYTSGIYQIGFTMSKFKMATNISEISSFRPGFFELQIKDIGLYTNATKLSSSTTTEGMMNNNISSTTPTIRTVSAEEVKRGRSPVVKLFLPIVKFLFSEKARRRGLAMKLLREKRGLSRRKAILYAIKARGPRVLGTILVDTLRTIVSKMLKFAFFTPFIVINKVRKFFNGGKKKNNNNNNSAAKAV